MVDGASLLSQMFWGFLAHKIWVDERGRQPARRRPRRSTTPTPARTGGTSRSGAIEPQFYAALLAGLGLADADLAGQHDREHWPAAEGAVRRRVRHPHARRVGGGVRGHRRLRHARAGVRRGGGAPARRGAGHDRRARRHRRRPPRPPGSAAPRPRPRGAPGSRSRWSRCWPTGRSTPRTTRAAPPGRRVRLGVGVERIRRRRPAGCGCGSGRPGCPGPWWWPS